MSCPFVGNVNMKNVSFGDLKVENGKSSVLLYKDNSSMKGNKLMFNLVEKALEPYDTKFSLDSVLADQDGSRRGLLVKIQDANSLRGLKDLDKHVVEWATKNSKELFKKNLTPQEVELRYKPIVTSVDKQGEEGTEDCVKFKVKCDPKKVPTQLHLIKADGTVEEGGGTLEHLCVRGASVSPILTAYSLWFMGGGTQFGVILQAEKMLIKPGVPRPPLSDFCSDVPLVTSKRDREEDEAVEAVEANKVAKKEEEGTAKRAREEDEAVEANKVAKKEEEKPSA